MPGRLRPPRYGAVTCRSSGVNTIFSPRTVCWSESGLELSTMERIRIEQHGFAGTLWLAGWLFTLGLVHVSFWKGLLALVLWPYYLGAALAAPLPH